jgi:hypothetical protein
MLYALPGLLLLALPGLMIYRCAQVLLILVVRCPPTPEGFQVCMSRAPGLLVWFLLLFLVGLFDLEDVGELGGQRELLQVDVGEQFGLRILQVVYLLGHLVGQFNKRLNLLVFVVVSEVLQDEMLDVVGDRTALGEVLKHAIGVFQVFAQVKRPSGVKGLLRGLSSQIFEMGRRWEMFGQCLGGGHS